MRKLFHGERNISPLALLGLIAVMAALVAAWLVTLQVQSSFHSFRTTVYDRCQARAKFDASQQDIYRALRDYYAHLDANIKHNAKPSQFVSQLDTETERTITALDRSLQTSASQSIGEGQKCLQYKP